MITMGSVLVLLLLLFQMETGQSSGGDFTTAGATAPGDVIIGGLFPIHEAVEKDGSNMYEPAVQRCVRLSKGQLTEALAMINAIETINKSPKLSHIGITLGYRIHDSCHDVSTGLRAMDDFAHQDVSGGGQNRSANSVAVVAVVGASYSEMSIAIARELTLHMIPQISYSSTAVILSDKTRFPAFMRTVPNDSYQTAAMVKLLSDSGWNWVGMITTDGDYGRSAQDSFVTQASEKGICVAFKEILPGSVNTPEFQFAMNRAAATIHKSPKVKVIVSFVNPTHMEDLYKKLIALTGAGPKSQSIKRIWVASDAWSSSSSVIGNVTLEEIGDVVGFTFKSGNLSSFVHYLKKLELEDKVVNNSFLEEFYAQMNIRRGSPGTMSKSKALEILRCNTDAGSVFSVEMAVNAIAQAVAHICTHKECKIPGSLKHTEVLKGLRSLQFEQEERKYKFDDKGDINLGYDVVMWRSESGKISVRNVVAEYHPVNSSFSYTSLSNRRQLMGLRNVVSKCSDSCQPGEFKKTAEGPYTCCYDCINCTENQYSDRNDSVQCLSCDPSTEWSALGSSGCSNKTLEYFSWHDGFAVVLLTFSGLGVLLVIVMGALFLHQRHTPVVKAAGGPLCQAILFSLVGSFISAVLFVGEPNDLRCKARQALFGLSFTLCVSCILVKSLKILLAFQFNPGLQHLLRRLYQPYVIVAGCMAAQVAICVCWLFLKSPFYNVVNYPKTRLAECHEGSYVAFGAMLGYIAVLALVCFICAFKGRKLPEKYNEAKFITFGMLLYLISWMIFVPVHVTTSGIYLPAVEMVVILISNYGILGCHFLPKCYVILFKKKENTSSAFRKNLFEFSSKDSKSASVSEISVSGEKHTSQPYVISASSLILPPAELIVPHRTSEVTNHTDTDCNCINAYRTLVMKQRRRLRRCTSI